MAHLLDTGGLTVLVLLTFWQRVWQSTVKRRTLMQDVLLPHEIEWLEKQQHRPNAATQVSQMSP